MSVFVRRGGTVEAKQYSVEVTKLNSTRYTTLVVNGTSLSVGTYTFDEGTEIVCTVSAQNTSTGQHCYISVDDENVLSGAGSYTYKVSANCQIYANTSSVSAMGSSFSYGYITITTV